MGIQFRLGPNDHKPVEDFLSRDHTGTDAITLDTKAARHQVAAAAAAVDAGLDVYWEPAAERLAEAGFGLDKFPLWNGQVRTTFSPARLNCIVSPKASVHSQSGGICPMFSPIVISWPSPSAELYQPDWPAAPRHPPRSTGVCRRRRGV